MKIIKNDGVGTTLGAEINKINDNFKDVIANLLKQQDSNLIFQGFAKPADDTPAATLNHAYYVIESGTVFGVAASEGQVLVGNGTGFEKKSIKEKADKIEVQEFSIELGKLHTNKADQIGFQALLARLEYIESELDKRLDLYPDNLRDGEDFEDGLVSLHLDDAFESVYVNAFPLMTAKGIKATIYVNSRLVGTTHPEHGKYMTWSQIAEMKAAGHDIQCHGAYGGSLYLELDDTQINQEYSLVNIDFPANNIELPKHTAYSGGDFDDHTLNLTDNYRKSGRSTVNGFITRKTEYFKLNSEALPHPINILKKKMDYAKANKAAITLYAHNVGVPESSLNAPIEHIEEVIDYAHSIGLKFVTHAELYDRLFYVDCRISRDCPDNQIDIICNNKLPSSAKICIERSIDGELFQEIGRINAWDIKYSDTNLDFSNTYYYRVRGIIGLEYLPYTQTRTFRESSLLLTAKGTGNGVATLQLSLNEGLTLTLDGNAKFYTNSAATEGESNTWKVRPQDYKMIYIKCISGTANLKFPKNALYTLNQWVSPTNAPEISGYIGMIGDPRIISVGGKNSLSGDISHYKWLQQLVISDNNTLSGDISDLVFLEALENNSILNTLSGDISNLINLRTLSVSSTLNRLYGDVSQLINLQFLSTSYGSNKITGDICNLTKLQYCNPAESDVYMSTVILLKNLCYIKNPIRTILSSENVNQLLADMWANRNEEKPRSERYIGIGYTNSSGAPTGQGLTDKANLLAYRSPNNDPTKPLWTVTTK